MLCSTVAVPVAFSAAVESCFLFTPSLAFIVCRLLNDENCTLEVGELYSM